jgi:cation diffusion facilitator family transporter
MDQKVSVARLSIISNTFLITLKVIVGFFTGSVSIISEAIHSFMDLLASVIAYFSVRISSKPADSQHNYGHGKFENISGIAEAGLIFIAAVWIIVEAVKKIIEPVVVEKIGYGFIVMLISALVNIVVSSKLYRVARETESVALEADALHLKTDVYTSLGVATGLGMLWITGIHLFDPVVAILVAVLILKESFNLFTKAFEPLLDRALPEPETATIQTIINQYCQGDAGYHNLRTRRAGSLRYIDFHLTVDPEMTVKEAHALCDRIEDHIKSTFRECEVTIHVENK